MSDAGIDSIEICANTHLLRKKAMYEEAEFLPIALEVKKKVKTPVIVVGRHHHVENIERILNETEIEYLSLSRPLIREPNLPNRWLSGDLSPATCIACDGCFKVYGKRCIFNKTIPTLSAPRV